LVVHAAASAEKLLANKQCHLEAAEHAMVLATKALAKEQHYRIKRAAALAEMALAKEQHC
jgi:hypothetical protein